MPKDLSAHIDYHFNYMTTPRPVTIVEYQHGKSLVRRQYNLDGTLSWLTRLKPNDVREVFLCFATPPRSGGGEQLQVGTYRRSVADLRRRLDAFKI